jgi:predicted nucleotidyltransferase
MEEIRKLVKDKELVVRKRVVNFLEKIFKYLGYEFRHDNYKSVAYGETCFLTPLEERAKNYIDAFNYLLSNKNNILTSKILSKFIYIIKQEEIDVNFLRRISSYYFCLEKENELDKALKFNLYVYKELEFLNHEERLVISLMLFNYSLIQDNIPCVQLVMKELQKYEEIKDKEDYESLYEFMKEVIINNKFQDKLYYRNLKPLTLRQIKRKILKDKDVLKDKYKVKSIYIFGSFCKMIERIDSDIDMAIRLSLDLTEIEKEQILKELKEYFYKVFKRFVDIHELMDVVHEDFIEEAVNIIKIY